VSEETPREALERASRTLKHFTIGVTTEPPERGLCIALSGYLDGDAANTVMDPLSSLVLSWGGTPKLTIDLAGLEYISSLGIGMLSTLAVSSHKRSIAMKLMDPQPSVLHVLELLGIPQYIPVVRTEKDGS
jgi:anti-anti-sigma factor